MFQNKKRMREEAFPLNSIQSKFVCPCTKIIILSDPKSKELREHRHACEEMAKKYGALYDAWESAVLTDDNVRADNWRNMRALYETFRAKFFENVEQVQQANKRRKLNEDKEMMVVEEVKLEKFQSMESLPKELMAPVDEGIPCANCLKSFMDFTDIVYLENCNHMVCKECLTETINLQYPDSCCPLNDCEKKLYEAEIRQALGDKAYDEL